MAEEAIYNKTDSGKAEVAATPSTLRRDLKALLDLIRDGESFTELCARVPQLPEDALRKALEELCALGYVAATAAPGLAQVQDVLRFPNRHVQEPYIPQ